MVYVREREFVHPLVYENKVGQRCDLFVGLLLVLLLLGEKTRPELCGREELVVLLLVEKTRPGNMRS